MIFLLGTEVSTERLSPKKSTSAVFDSTITASFGYAYSVSANIYICSIRRPSSSADQKKPTLNGILPGNIKPIDDKSESLRCP